MSSNAATDVRAAMQVMIIEANSPDAITTFSAENLTSNTATIEIDGECSFGLANVRS